MTGFCPVPIRSAMINASVCTDATEFQLTREIRLL
jgi:hypothetical protein